MPPWIPSGTLPQPGLLHPVLIYPFLAAAPLKRKPPPLPGPCPHTALHPPLRTPVHADKKYQEHPFCPTHITLGDFHTPFPYDGIKTERRFLINGTGLQTCHRSDALFGHRAAYPRPAGRNDCGSPRKLDDDLKEKIAYLKERYPRMGAAAIFRQLKEDGSIKSGEVSQSTVNRYVNRLALEAGNIPAQDMRRYERPHINEIWCGDSSIGPYIKTQDGRKRRVYVIALIDDASRLVTGAGVFFEDTFANLMSVMKSAVAKHGVPRVFNFDNGSAYKNKQMELLAARIGAAINYCKPYTPTAKAKVERWFPSTSLCAKGW